MKQTCTYHCSECGQHFHGLGAYDAHLVRTPNRDAPTRSYDLNHEAGLAVGLRPWTRTGTCELTGQTLEPVLVWQLIPTAEAVQRWGRLTRARA